MKLIREFVDMDLIEILKEDGIDTNGNKVKVLKLKGPFLVADVRNKNNRIYPLPVIVREVKRFNEERIAKNRAVGTCDHEDSPQINLERISHIIESLVMEKNVGMGVARVIDTPTGRILKTLVNEGIILGMSSRGIGTLQEDGTVNDDFSMLSVDAVLDNSAPGCFVEGILENKEYIMNGDQIVEVAVQNLQKKVDKKYDVKSMSSEVLSYMLDFLGEIKGLKS
jgi:hypothetical protein